MAVYCVILLLANNKPSRLVSRELTLRRAGDSAAFPGDHFLNVDAAAPPPPPLLSVPPPELTVSVFNHLLLVHFKLIIWRFLNISVVLVDLLPTEQTSFTAAILT